MDFLYTQTRFVQTKLELTLTPHSSFHLTSYHSPAPNYLPHPRSFFYSPRSLDNMTLQTPQSGFDYNVDPRSWSQEYVKPAYPSQGNVVKRLFDRTAALLEEHGLFPEAFKNEPNPRKLLRSKREEVAGWLQSEFANEIEIIGFPTFGRRLCQGAVTYMGGAGKRVRVREKSCKATKTRDHSANL